MGTWTATRTLYSDNVTAATPPIVRLEVYDSDTTTILASRNATRNEFEHADRNQEFAVNYTNSVAGDRLEFRTYWYDHASTVRRGVTVR
ncbi:hypothetical protein [Streptomyces sp. ISL-100]|uniref:hypothetical protein n=1 Tax=Streptomyces sp. ISL-100 TaxID=2819173 RepID=UPI001BEC5568|nr:hypothetical protein [Streptomyces sp. ISL-100]MBT2395385.1 hypothetical protein [Streptomyces sp. ISL-100]